MGINAKIKGKRQEPVLDMKICPKCGTENLDFKIFCGSCGETLPGTSPQSVSSPDIKVDEKSSYSQKIVNTLGSSRILGILIMTFPLIFTFFSYDPFFYLSWKGLAAPGLIYGLLLIIIVELMFLSGAILFNREYRLAYVEPPVRGILVFLLTFSIAPFIILTLTLAFGAFPEIYAALIFLAFLLFFSWLFFFGWLGESRPEKYLLKKNMLN